MTMSVLGKTVQIDESDLVLVQGKSWRLDKFGYAVWNTHVDGKWIRYSMHRLILGVRDSSKHVDHINQDKLDNRRENLRICSNAENIRNRHVRSDSRSGLKGVTWHPQSQKWRAKIKRDGKTTYLGLFATADDAHAAYVKAALDFHGEFACAN